METVLWVANMSSSYFKNYILLLQVGKNILVIYCHLLCGCISMCVRVRVWKGWGGWVLINNSRERTDWHLSNKKNPLCHSLFFVHNQYKGLMKHTFKQACLLSNNMLMMWTWCKSTLILKCHSWILTTNPRQFTSSKLAG